MTPAQPAATCVAPAATQTPDTLISLIHLTAKQDRSAFTALYRASSRKLFGAIVRILNNDALAEEVLQEVYLKIWQNAASFDSSKASAISWLVAIARNRALDEIRKRSLPGSDADTDMMPDDAAGPAGQFEHDEDMRRFEHCLTELAEPRRSMLRLAYLRGFSQQELADHFEEPLGTVKSWIHRGLKQLRECLA